MERNIEIASQATRDGSGVPAWEDINDIITDLQRVMDDMTGGGDETTRMRASIARVIAQMREEKVLETSRDRCKALLDNLGVFWLKDAGLCRRELDYLGHDVQSEAWPRKTSWSSSRR